MEFEWDPNKAEINLRKHGISFQEATTVFGDPLSISVPDPDHSVYEDRYIIVGLSTTGRLLIVSYTERGEHIRIITARLLTPQEKKDYEDGEF
jgi:hypothetical protein